MTTTTTIRKIIRADGSEQSLDGCRTMRQIGQAIGADVQCSVPLRHLGAPLQVMICDDIGHARGKPINYTATELYHANCKPGTLHQIVGDVAIVLDDDFFDDIA